MPIESDSDLHDEDDGDGNCCRQADSLPLFNLYVCFANECLRHLMGVMLAWRLSFFFSQFLSFPSFLRSSLAGMKSYFQHRWTSNLQND